ncbi:recombinase family protein [Bradyrhizobium sp. URHD0069]|uniref:recombinase family protein n=1 Tax=Bradyrhizobium sp. URHD0069 TaxID=1380355 RepID=UPI001FD8D82A|nr:recombinase family protein [Bradyrhizobium sp. URHD0069]
MGRAVAYLRVSTQQQQRSGLGIEAQRAAIERFAAAESLTIIEEYAEFETGKGADALDRRPQLAAALAAARKAKCSIVVSKLDRLSRDVAFISGLMAQRVQHDVEQEFLELDDFCPDAAASFPPSVGVKRCVARGLDRDARRMAFHDSVEHSPRSSRVIPSGHEHNGSEPMLVAPWRKCLNFTFGRPSLDCGDSHDICDAKRPQLANLLCPLILVRDAPADELMVFCTRRVHKNRNSL